MANSKIVKFKDKKGNSYPYLYVDEMTGVYYAVKRIGDAVKKKPLGTNFNEARTQVLDAIAELGLDTPVNSDVKLFKDYFLIMIEEKKALDIKPTTLARIDAVWRLSLEPYWAFLTVDEINQDQVTAFISWHRRNRPGIQFINVFKYLGNVFSIMAERGALPLTQKPKLVIPKDEQKQHDKQKGRYITDDEFKAIAKNSDFQTKLILNIAYCTGMRKMEILSVDKERVEKMHGHYVFKLDTDDTKTGLARIVPIPKFLNSSIEAQLTHKSAFLFPMKSDYKRHLYGQLLDKEWLEAKTKAKIKGRMRVHDLRHTAASNLAKDGINPVIAVTMLGMSLVTFQKSYLKLQVSDIIVASESNAKRLA